MNSDGLPDLDLSDLERRLGHFFARPALLFEALCHRSYTYEHIEEGLEENERLEFLGDAVLDLAVSTLLYNRLPEADEGTLTRLRSSLVNERSLSELAKQLELGRFIRLGRGEAASGGSDKPSILADAMEAVLGAFYLDAGFEPILKLVEGFWADQIAGFDAIMSNKDYKTTLQEHLQREEKATPNYRVLRSEGPDHERVFFVEVRIKRQSLGQGQGRSKKEAEQDAARAALEGMGLNDE